MNIKVIEQQEIIEIYGLDHSPWVQSVLLCLYDNKFNYSLKSVPSLSLFFRSGVMMPALRFKSNGWKLDSAEILESLGYKALSTIEKKLIFKTWQGVQHRVDNPFKFFYRFSICKGFYKSKLINFFHHILRPFIAIYFFLLLNIIKIKIKKIHIKENFFDQYSYWNNKLSLQGTDFFGGSIPNIIDYQLFGIIQSHCSIPYQPLIKTLQENRELNYIREWISNMHIKFAHYPHLYSANFFCPKQNIVKKATYLERLAYWFGLIIFFVILPFTITLLIYLFIIRK